MPRSLFTLGWIADRYGKRYLLAGGYFLVLVMVVWVMVFPFQSWDIRMSDTHSFQLAIGIEI